MRMILDGVYLNSWRFGFSFIAVRIASIKSDSLALARRRELFHQPARSAAASSALPVPICCWSALIEPDVQICELPPIGDISANPDSRIRNLP